MTEATTTEWHVYMLSCADGSLYTGVTKDLERRVEQHNRGVGARYTRSRLPVEICYQEPVASHGDALRREITLKRLSRRQKLALVGHFAESNRVPSA